MRTGNLITHINFKQRVDYRLKLSKIVKNCKKVTRMSDGYEFSSIKEFCDCVKITRGRFYSESKKNDMVVNIDGIDYKIGEY